MNPEDILNDLQLLYDHAPCGYHSLDVEGKVIWVNNTELKMLGHSREEMIGQKITRFLTEESINIFIPNFLKIKQGERIQDIEIEMICKDSSILPVSMTAQIIKDTELIGGNGELVLVVDDNEIILQIIQAVLVDCNYRVILARDGINAIAVYAQHQKEISIVLMDISMPKMDGLTAIRTLLLMNPEVKIIANSGLPNQRQDALSAGAKAFLSKPHTAEELLAALSQIIRLS